MQPTSNPVMRLLGSYGLAIVTLLGMFVVTLVGTFAQKDVGLFEAQRIYFNSWIAWHPLQVGDWSFSTPLPGGALLMAVLSVNLAVGGLVRIRKSARTAGVIVAHLGIALLMAAGLVSMVSAQEGFVALLPGEQASEFRSHYEYEVAIRSADDLERGSELLIPDADLRVLEIGLDGRPASLSPGARVKQWMTTGSGERRETQVFTSERLPFALELSAFVPNAGLRPEGDGTVGGLSAIDGVRVFPLPKNELAELNTPAVMARALGPDGEVLDETVLSPLATRPWAVAVGDAVYAVSLREKRMAMPFRVRLDEFFKDEHPRTEIAAEYRSDVTAMRGDGREERVRIEMNHPLRENGFVMFQASYGERPTPEGPKTFSQFAVVKNPSDQWPKYACFVIGAGMVWAFGRRLASYLAKQARERAAAREVTA